MPEYSMGRPLGVDPDAVSLVAKHKLGSKMEASDGSTRIYVKGAAGGHAAGDVVKFNSSYVCAASGAAGPAVGVVPVTVAANEHFWLVMEGKVSAKVTASMGADVLLDSITAVSLTFNVAPVMGASAGPTGVRGVSLAAESGGKAVVYLF